MKCEWTLLLYSYNFRVQIQYQHIKGFWINVFYTMLWVWLCKGFYLSKTFNQNKHRYNIHTLISSSKLPLKPHLACCPSLGAARPRAASSASEGSRQSSRNETTGCLCVCRDPLPKTVAQGNKLNKMASKKGIITCTHTLSRTQLRAHAHSHLTWK